MGVHEEHNARGLPRASTGRPGRALVTVAATALAIALLAGCQSNNPGGVDPTAGVIQLSGTGDETDFDDITYSTKLARVLVPAREDGLYLVEPTSGKARRLDLPEPLRSAESVDEGQGRLFVLDRETTTLAVLDPADGRLLASVELGDTPDYVRYVQSTGELWVSAPSAGGIEIFTVSDPATTAPKRTGFIPVPDGPEGLTIATVGGHTSAFTHAGSDLIAIDAATHRLQRWFTGCDGTHGFPQVDTQQALALASCARDGRVVLLDSHTGARLGHYDVGGGESLPAWSEHTGHFYVRSDPGTRLATLAATRTGLTLVRDVDVPTVGHCLSADDQGHYWTCDAAQGRLLRFSDPAS